MSLDVDNGVVRLQGFDDLVHKLREIPNRLRRKVLREALAAGARLVRDEARRNAPVLSQAAPYRTPGTVKKAIVVRTSKVARREGNVGVFVNVRPVRGTRQSNHQIFKQRGKYVGRTQTRADSSARNPNDPFYWRFLEFGWTPGSRRAGLATKKERYHARKRGAVGQIPGRGFLRSGIAKLPQALKVFEDRMTKWFAKLNATGKFGP